MAGMVHVGGSFPWGGTRARTQFLLPGVLARVREGTSSAVCGGRV